MKKLILIAALLFAQVANAGNLVPIFRYLDTVGDGSGTKNAVGNYATTPQTFQIVVPAGKGYTIESMTIHLSGATNFQILGYGSINAGLTNGVVLQAVVGGVTLNFDDGAPFKTNDDLGHISANVNHVTYSGTGDSLVVQFQVSDYGVPLTLNPGDSLQVVLHDNFTGLSSQHFIVKGYSN